MRAYQSAEDGYMTCPEALRLFDLYQEALTALHASRLRLPDAEDYPSSFAKASRARSDYSKHVELHGCRTTRMSTEPDGMQDWLRAEVDRARIAYQQASQTYTRFLDIAADTEVSTDGILAQEQARRIRTESLQAYSTAVKRLADYVLRKKVPDNVRKLTSRTPPDGTQV